MKINPDPNMTSIEAFRAHIFIREGYSSRKTKNRLNRFKWASN